jgi:hypothetical protein
MDGDENAPAVTLRGTVTLGVERGTLLLDAGADGTYQVLGGDRTVLRPGRRVEVSGRRMPHLRTTGQQGVPFRVTSARPL